MMLNGIHANSISRAQHHSKLLQNSPELSQNLLIIRLIMHHFPHLLTSETETEILGFIGQLDKRKHKLLSRQQLTLLKNPQKKTNKQKKLPTGNHNGASKPSSWKPGFSEARFAVSVSLALPPPVLEVKPGSQLCWPSLTDLPFLTCCWYSEQQCCP